ncbi:MAG: hypothetical protein ACE5ER_01670 [Nitrospinaceae bacterium]
MTVLSKVESLVKKTPCPVCLNSRFEVRLCCEMPHEPCDYHAVCGHCGHKILVSPDWRPREDLLQTMRESMSQKGCPECGDSEFDIEFLCDLGTQDCFFLAKCGRSGHYVKIDHKGIRPILQGVS